MLDNRRDLINIKIQKEPQFAGEKPKQLAEGWGSYLENVTFDAKKGPLWDIFDGDRAT